MFAPEYILYAYIYLSLIPITKAAVDTTGRDTRWDILSLNIYDGDYVPYRELPQAEMMENKEPVTFSDLMNSVGRMSSTVDDLVTRMDTLIEKDRKRKK